MRNNLVFSLLLLAFSAAGQGGAGGFFGLLAGREDAAPTGLLDAYPNASAMYSVGVLLRSAHTVTDVTAGSETDGITAAYTVQLVRSSDAAIRSFTPDEIESGAATTWVGAGTGRVSIQYDQTGLGNHATQTSATHRPILVEADTLVRLNGKPAIRYNLHGLDAPVLYGVSDTLSVLFSVYSLTAPGSIPYIFGSEPSARGLVQVHLTNTRTPRFGTGRSVNTFITSTGSANVLNTQYITSLRANRVNITFRRNQTEEVYADTNTNYSNASFNKIGYGTEVGVVSAALVGKISALAFYRTAVDTPDVETSLNDYFNAY